MIKTFHSVEDVVSDENFLAWYFKGSEEMIQDWEQWMNNNSSQQPLINEAIAFMDNLATNEQTISSDHTESKLQQLHTRIRENETEVAVMPARRNVRGWWIGAAAVILFLLAGIAFWQPGRVKPVLASEYGKVSNNQLPDGSTMILNANSSAMLSKGWTEGKDREVWLNGEAFFKVKKTPQRSRFIVHTNNLDVIVTGTQFNVLNRDNRTTVLLTEGSVIIRTRDGKELAMKPGDYVEMNGEQIDRKLGMEENVLAWKDNKLAFDSTSLREVAKIIKQHYGKTVTLADETVANKSISGIMPNDNLDVLLKTIEEAVSVKITRTDTAIIVSSN